MLRRIIKPFLAVSGFVFLLFALVSDADKGESFLWSFSKHSVFLEELEAVGQETFPGFLWFHQKTLNPVRRRAEESVAKVLAEEMRDWSKEDIRKLSRHIVMLGERYQFSPAFILSLIEVESQFQPDAVSHRGAIGLMQIKLDTAEPIAQQLSIRWEGEKSLRDPQKNIEMGLYYMDELRQKFKTPRYYLAAYNQGPTRVSRVLRSGADLSHNYYNKVMQSYLRYSDSNAVGRY